MLIFKMNFDKSFYLLGTTLYILITFSYEQQRGYKEFLSMTVNSKIPDVGLCRLSKNYKQ